MFLGSGPELIKRGKERRCWNNILKKFFSFFLSFGWKRKLARVCGAAERDGCAGGVVCRSASGFLSGELQNNVR